MLAQQHVSLNSRDEFDSHGGGFTAANAKTRNPAPQSTRFKRTKQYGHDPGSAGADRMPQGTCATVDIEPVQRNLEFLGSDHGNDGYGSGRKESGFMRMSSMGDDPCYSLDTTLACHVRARQHQRGGAAL
jgi:hypothetical protein